MCWDKYTKLITERLTEREYELVRKYRAERMARYRGDTPAYQKLGTLAELTRLKSENEAMRFTLTDLGIDPDFWIKRYLSKQSKEVESD